MIVRLTQTMTGRVCLHAGSTSNRIGPGRTFRVLYNTRQGFRAIKFQTPILLLNDTKRGEHRIHPGRTACGPQVFSLSWSVDTHEYNV